MLYNYFKTALRNLLKRKTFTVINIAGLSIGIAACLFILQYVSFQLSFDQFNLYGNDLYRVVNDRYQDGKLVQHGTITYSAIGKALQDDYPEVVNHSRVEPEGPLIITVQGKKIGNESGLAVDNSFLSMFSYPVVAGDRVSPLDNPYNVILTASLAEKLFGVTPADLSRVVGKTLLFETDSMPYKVTAVCADVPENSHLSFDFLTAYSTIYTGPNAYKEADYDFTESDFWHYVQLRKGADYRRLNAKLAAFSERHFQGNRISGSVEKFYLQPVSRAHLYSDFEYEIGNTASAVVVWGLLIIALLIIGLAWVNYINLSTAKSLERAREVGIRKVSGATKNQLIRQFLMESCIVNLAAFLIAMAAVVILQPAFNSLTGHHLSLAYLLEKGLSGYSIAGSLVALLVAGILVSGFYPALVLSSFRPAVVLKGKFTGSAKGILLRKVLVTGQFAITVALVTGSMIIYQQMRYLSRQRLGINLSQVLVVNPPELTRFDSTFIQHENAFTAELTKIPHVSGAATSWNVPGGETGRSFHVRRADQDPSVHYTMRHTGISQGFVSLFGIKILAGRDFSGTDFNPDFGEVHNLLINQSAAKLLGYSSPADAVGKQILRNSRKWDIIGVINDYHQKSLRYPLEPTLFLPAYSTNSSISVKVDTRDLETTIGTIKKTFDAFYPGNLFTYYFLDDHFNKQYADDQLFGKVFAIFAAFAILVACLGLLGLSLFATAQRTKEIGIRKVLGASVSHIVYLLSKDFVKLIALAILIASPLAWYLMHNWLDGFAYRIRITWLVFALSGALAVMIALATVSIQAIKTALSNPVKALRTE